MYFSSSELRLGLGMRAYRDRSVSSFSAAMTIAADSMGNVDFNATAELRRRRTDNSEKRFSPFSRRRHSGIDWAGIRAERRDAYCRQINAQRN